MTTPFEELEYLADYLPEEGESVVVTRQAGELVCESVPHSQQRDGISDPEFYGRLVQSNERLKSRSSLPAWCSSIFFFWACVALHTLTGLGWQGWYFDLGLGLIVLLGCFAWIRRRQASLFRTEIRPMLNWQIRRRRLDRYAVLGVMRQHAELKTLLDEMSRWED